MNKKQATSHNHSSSSMAIRQAPDIDGHARQTPDVDDVPDNGGPDGIGI